MIVTLGSFDGVHLGHQALLNRAKLEAKKRRFKSCAIVFKIPPRMVLNPAHPMALLSTPEEKQYLLKKFGIDKVDMMQFDTKISKLPAFVFLRDQIIQKRKARGIVIGHDFRFGCGRSAGAVEMVRWGQEFKIPVWVVPPFKRNKITVSSTLLRQLLSNQNYRKAVGFLGHPYVIEGLVVRGQSLGQKLGFPTANLSVPQGKVVPRGVFAVRAVVNKRTFEGVCNIGVRPTINSANKLTIEAHLFGQPGVLRGKRIVLELLSWLRAERCFDSFPDLTRAIQADVKKAKLYFSKENSV